MLYRALHHINRSGEIIEPGQIIELAGIEEEQLVGCKAVEPVEPAKAGKAHEKDLESMTKAELVEHAKAHGLELDASMKKDELVAAILGK